MKKKRGLGDKINQDKGCIHSIVTKSRFFQLISLLVVLVSSMIVYALVAAETELDAYDYGPEKYLVVPVCIALIRLVTGKLLDVLVDLEETGDQAADFHSYFSRILMSRMLLLYVMVGATYQLSATESSSSSDPSLSTYDPSDICLETLLGMLFYRVLLWDIIIELAFVTIFPFFQVCIINRVVSRCKKHCTSSAPPVQMDPTDESIELERLQAVVDDQKTSKKDSAIARKSIKSYNDLGLEREKTIYEESIKEEFNVLDNIADILYRQMLILSGLSTSPFLPIVGFILGIPLMYLKYIQVNSCSKRKHVVIPVTKQHRLFRFSLVIVVMLSVAPYTMFLSYQTECGPYANYVELFINENVTSTIDGFSLDVWAGNVTIGDILVLELNNEFPGWITVVVDTLSNTMVLWFTLVLVIVALIADIRINASMSAEIGKLTIQLKTEIESHAHDKISLKVFLDSLKEQTQYKYKNAITYLAEKQLSILCRTPDADIIAMIREVNGSNASSAANEVEQQEILNQVFHYRHLLAVMSIDEVVDDEENEEKSQ